MGRLKLVLTLGLAALLCGPYFALLHLDLRAPHLMAPTALDRAIASQPAWIWVYFTLYPFLLAPPLLCRSPATLRRFARGFAFLCAAAHTIFLVAPTAIAPAVEPAANLGTRLVRAVDGQGNACPSLHAALAVYTALWVPRLLAHSRRARWLAAAGWTWAAAIVFSTLPTRRHVAVDLVAGAALAGALHAGAILLAGRKKAPRGAEAPALIPTPRTTQAARALVSRGLEGQLTALRRLDAGKRALELGAFGGLWAAGAWLTLAAVAGDATLAGWASLLGTGLSAIALNAFVLLLHEGMHHTLFAGRRANRWTSVALGGLVLMSYTAYRVLHTRHHDFLGDPRDPDDYHNYTARPRLVWCLHYVRLLVGTFLYLLAIPVLAWRHGSRSDRKAILGEYALLIPVWTLAFRLLPATFLIHGWAVPVVLVAYLTSLRGFTQHGIGVAADPFLASRSIDAPRLVALCLLNENFHLEHHLFPEVPSYNLRRLHGLLESRIPYRVTGRSYLRFLGAFLRATPAMDERPIGVQVRA